jgi:hypothetical protein
VIDLGWWATGALLALGLAVLLWSRWESLKPFNPTRPRLLNHTFVQLLAIVFILLMAAHMATLIAGRPITGRL